MLTAEQIATAQKSNIDTLFGVTNTAFDSLERLFQLNISASKAALTEASGQVQAVLGAKDVQELLALQASVYQPLAEKIASYSRHWYDIVSGASTELGRTVETQVQEAHQKLVALVENAAQNAPAGSEAAVAALRSAVTAGSNAFETANKGLKNAISVAEKNFEALSATAVSASKAAPTTAKKR